jgi:Ca2+-transporting ATPase
LTRTLPIGELVVGDVIKLESGMRVPADCILLEGTDFATDESGLTGEPEQVEKSSVTDENYLYNPNPFLLAKTLVQTG